MFRGVFTPVVTAFKDGRIDYDAQASLVERLIASGVDGILFCGTIGEFQALSTGEKKEFFSWAAAAVGGRTKTLAGTGGVCVEEVLSLTGHAAGCGMDGAVVMSPYYFRLGDDDLYRFYAAVADVGLPVILYNFPDRTNVSLSAALVLKLAMGHGGIVGIKDTVDAISHTRQIISVVKAARPDFSVLSGFDEYMVPNLMAGGDGILTGMTNVAPDLFVSMLKAWVQGDLAVLRAGQKRINALMELYPLTQPFIAAIKCAVSTLVPGVSEELRAPFGGVSDAQRRAVRAVLERAGVS